MKKLLFTHLQSKIDTNRQAKIFLSISSGDYSGFPLGPFVWERVFDPKEPQNVTERDIYCHIPGAQDRRGIGKTHPKSLDFVLEMPQKESVSLRSHSE